MFLQDLFPISGYPYLDAEHRRFEDAVGVITASSIFNPKDLPQVMGSRSLKSSSHFMVWR